MNKLKVINQLISIRDNIDLFDSDKEGIEAINTAISILSKEQSRRFNRSLLDRMLDEIGQEYTKIANPFSIWEVIENVKYKYEDEIATLVS